MPYTSTAWTAGVTALSQPNMNNLETQYTEATNSLGVNEAVEGFVLTGLSVSKTGAAQVTIAAGSGYLKQTDGTFRYRSLSSTPETTVTINTTYFADLKPDGTVNWATSHSGSNYLTLASVTTDGSGNVVTVTDTRQQLLRWLGGQSGMQVSLPPQNVILGNVLAAPPAITTASAVAGAGMGTGAYSYVVTFAADGYETLPSAAKSVTTTGGNNQVSLSGIPTSADPRVAWRKIYRTAVGGSTYSWVATIGDNSTTTYTDAASDAKISSTIKIPPTHSTFGATLRGGYPWNSGLTNPANVGQVTGVTFGQTGMVTGDSSTAALFNGTTGRVSFAVGGLPVGNSPWSLEAIAKPTNATNGVDGVVLFMGTGSTGQAAFFSQKSSGGWLVGTWGGAGNDYGPFGTSVAGTKHHIVATYDGTTITLYIDGASAGTGSPTARTLTQTQGRIGDAFSGSEQLFFPGTVQKAAFYNYALSLQQVAAHNTLVGGASGSVTYDLQVADDAPLRYFTLGDASGATSVAESSRYETIIASDGQVKTALPISLDRGLITSDGAGSLTTPTLTATTLTASTFTANTAINIGPSTSSSYGLLQTQTAFSKQVLATPVAGGAALYQDFVTWDGASQRHNFGIGSAASGTSVQTWIKDGGAIGQVAGQATAGSFGVPVIVAQALDFAVSTTGDQTVLSYAPPAAGVYRLSGYFKENNGSATTITFRFTYSDPDIGGTSTVYFTGGNAASPTYMNAIAYASGANIGACGPQVVKANTGTNIIVHWNNSAGTPSDKIQVFIERLS